MCVGVVRIFEGKGEVEMYIVVSESISKIARFLYLYSPSTKGSSISTHNTSTAALGLHMLYHYGEEFLVFHVAPLAR